MHRQSLGSPGGKLQPNGGAASASGGAAAEMEEEEEVKSGKVMRCGSRSGRTIHLIPLLTLLCFLVLYLCSHDPSAKDLASFSGAAALLDRTANLGGEVGRYIGAEGGAVSAIRGLKAAAGKPRHRKLGVR